MRTVHVPESIAGLVTRRMLVMTFLEGTKITQARSSPRPRRGFGLLRAWRNVVAHQAFVILWGGASAMWPCKTLILLPC